MQFDNPPPTPEATAIYDEIKELLSGFRDPDHDMHTVEGGYSIRYVVGEATLQILVHDDGNVELIRWEGVSIKWQHWTSVWPIKNIVNGWLREYDPTSKGEE